MAKRIVFQRPDGSLVFREPAEPMLPGESEAMYLDRIALANPKPGYTRLDTAGVDVTALPGRRFRDCWRWGSGGVQVNVPLARQQRLAEIAADGEPRMAKAHGKWIHAMIKLDGLKKKAIEDYCAALEQVQAKAQTDIAAITTPDTLAAYNPTWPVEPE